MAASTAVTESVRAAYVNPRRRITRRLAVYEADAVTLWKPDNFAERVTEGEVSVDADRDERRQFSCVLVNDDDLLDHNPNGFWYDKIIKMYRGIKYKEKVYDVPVRRNLFKQTQGLTPWGGASTNMAVVNGRAYKVQGRDFTAIRAQSTAEGITTGLSLTSVQSATTFTTIAAGTRVTFSVDVRIDNDASISTQLQFVFRDDANNDSAVATQIDPLTPQVRQGVKGQWVRHRFTATIKAARNLTRVYVFGYAQDATVGITTGIGLEIARPRLSINDDEPIFFDGTSTSDSDFRYAWLGSANASESMQYTHRFADRHFEIQTGEFMIDTINSQRFPSSISVSGRDYSKKLLLDKLSADTSFPPGALLDDVVKTLATNGGIRKFRLGAEGVTVGTNAAFARKASRWECIRNLCTALNIEVFFDREGYLVTRPFRDVSTSAPSLTLTVDQSKANVVDFSKSSSDSRIFNHVVITGTSEEETVSGYKYIAIRENNDPQSPTSIQRIGRRTFELEVAYLTSQAAANQLADRMLAVAALEDFQLTFSAVSVPWMEAGDILEFDDPDESNTVPTRFLYTSFTLPVALGPMSGNGKRIVIVGKPNETPEEADQSE